jgi:hypothetical protein
VLYEQRLYSCVPGKLPDLLDRFETKTLKVFQRLGIRPVGFWTTIFGDSNQEVMYILAWKDMAEKERVWATLLSDPEWLAIRAETERDGPIVANAKSSLLAPTSFSGLS